MSTSDLFKPLATDQEAEMAEVAQRGLMAALEHSGAQRIALVDANGALAGASVLELPPQALRLFADMLGMMAQRRSFMLVSQNDELTTQDAAELLNVSRPFVIKEIEGGRLRCRKVGRHRRIEFEELRRYQAAQRERSDQALQKLADLTQELGLGY
jgi:excisionase family DNA binding protein